jgi:hypothetical protein
MAGEPLYQSVRCPKCHKAKVTRYKSFRCCGKRQDAATHLVNAEGPATAAPKPKRDRPTPAPTAQNELVVAW